MTATAIRGHDPRVCQLVTNGAHALDGSEADVDRVVALIGDAHYVLMGEASHGTHEFYDMRAAITRRLITHHHFAGVAVEADWPDAYRVNRYVRGIGDDRDANQALAGFRRFPQWMWRNTDVLDFVTWLRACNDRRSAGEAAGFYGLDLYSMHASIDAVLAYLDATDPIAAERARHRYACFEQAGDDPREYGRAVTSGYAHSCEQAVVAQLVEMRHAAAEAVRLHGPEQGDARFYAEQNAVLVRDAERYYRAMFGGRAESWNRRDTHMAETLEALAAFLGRGASRPKLVVWAHNSHLGDARATDMSRHGEHNVGQLVRTRHGSDAVLIGFTTATGSVTAASDWDAPVERKTVRAPLGGSIEALFHEVAHPDFLLDLRRPGALRTALSMGYLERAIGAIYRPETERQSHYFGADLAHQFDAVLHYDRTHALEPLERTGLWNAGELPATYPSGL